MTATTKFARLVPTVGLALALSACISFGSEPPPSLLTLTPERTPVAGTGARGTAGGAIAVSGFDAPKSIAVTRVPVQIDASNIAYLEDAQWVDRPARLFQTLLAETLRNRSSRIVTDGSDPDFAADTRVRGSLVSFGYDAQSSSVVVRVDAVLEGKGREITTRRFEQTVPGIPAEVGPVGTALNEAANDVAQQIADWVG
ncbi:ABC-type transport auxiliary lipoprotein family protein [Erythrobacter sp. LQ02-29]|uniref:ABC-type transport auxiliary lipoprotein family protein n=1 Tax=Erythrobacter sp. LQ02-29 TaxID=2920384 RepID=UPI001F4DF94E|nr:LPS assembly lipoprotein LptE [Erythrobacter sp. LQ02-29]MCP9222450.1 ABC-type transport auxiliary lipoprotein family protein [Erythrobacter sp. LQ02-29]